MNVFYVRVELGIKHSLASISKTIIELAVRPYNSRYKPLSKKSHPWSETLPNFAERIYAVDHIERQCIDLQDQYGVNVNILLWILWLEQKHIQLPVLWLEDVLISIDTTSQLTVNRLREIRHAIKAQPNFTRVQAKLIAKSILNAEISIERILLQRLQDLTARFLDAKSANTDAEQLSLHYYLSFMGVEDPEKYVFELAAERNSAIS